MQPGEWRTSPEHDVVVGRHVPPSSNVVAAFMQRFEQRYSFAHLGKGARILAIPAAHHRFNYVHPFPDGNGRVSRLMSHAMAHKAGIAAHGLWSVSRGLARGLESRGEYKQMMDLADTPCKGDLDGRGNLSQGALEEFTLWFLRICIDQVQFMTDMFDLTSLSDRYQRFVIRHESLKPESAKLLLEALMRGEFERGEAPRITGLPERTARRVLNDVVEQGLLASRTPKGPVSLRFPADVLDEIFPKLYPLS
nr:Fic family protein [Woeseia oceani]